MSEVTAEQVKQMWSTSPDYVSHQFGDALREFGYPSIEDVWVKQEIQRLYDGGEPVGGPSMFVSGWLKDGLD